jgi:hypothetical protein
MNKTRVWAQPMLAKRPIARKKIHFIRGNERLKIHFFDDE